MGRLYVKTYNAKLSLLGINYVSKSSVVENVDRKLENKNCNVVKLLADGFNIQVDERCQR